MHVTSTHAMQGVVTPLRSPSPLSHASPDPVSRSHRRARVSGRAPRTGPSSSQLARGASWSAPKLIIEYGPGMGASASMSTEM